MNSGNCKVCFVHIPKTGGTSVREVIEKLDEREAIPKTFYAPHGKDLNKYINILNSNPEIFRFTFVRNPWDRAVSSYLYMCAVNEINEKTTGFKKFISDYCNDCYDHPNKNEEIKWHMIEQHLLVYDEQKPMVDSVGRFENLQTDFNRILEKINIPPQSLPHKKKTKRKHYAKYYDAESRELVGRLYAKDIELFNYEFDCSPFKRNQAKLS